MDMEEQFSRNGYGDEPSLWDKIWRDDEGHGEVVIFQWPNVWLIAWAFINFLSVVSPTRNFSQITWWIGFVLLTIWSILEITKGVNYFRRAFGAVILALNI